MEDNQWMNYLRNSNVDIFEMIKKAIMVAASDHPQEFQNKRDMIAQTLFSSENEDETTTVVQVLKMKQILDQSSSHESVLLDSLSKLQQMVKSVNILKLTGVGISVNALRKHASKKVAKVSTTLVKEWKRMVNEWMKDSENMQQQKGGESEANPENPPKIDQKQIIVPESNPKRSLIVRIKLKKVEPKGPETPEQRVEKENDDGVTRVLRIKGILDDKTVSESVVLESLMKLSEMSLSVKTLQETGIERSVRVLLKHGSKDIRQITWAMVNKWKGIVDEYIKKESSLKTERKVERVDLEKSENRMKGCIEEKVEAAKRKMVEAYKEVEKKKRRIRVL